jgi:hypothetical protein
MVVVLERRFGLERVVGLERVAMGKSSSSSSSSSDYHSWDTDLEAAPKQNHDSLLPITASSSAHP